jgi:sulfatase maturation enzyme AslB (radical SAM superfamily)
MYNHDGAVKNCIRSSEKLGDIKQSSIQDIVLGLENTDRQQNIVNKQSVEPCKVCYELEHAKSFDIISDRVFYIRELKPARNLELYSPNKFDLQTIDVRWTNLCNFACVYCAPEFSSKWASELNQHVEQPNDQAKEEFKEYIFDNAKQLRHVYLAGGEPLLMKENLELLDRLSPDVNLRINTNLSCVDTNVFERICEFKNVHWTVSLETMEDEYEYIRYGGKWTEFQTNLKTITDLGHKVTFNMLYFLLNYQSLFDCVDYLTDLGYHPNAFVIGALLRPDYLNIRHLPREQLQSIKQELESRIAKHPGFLLENSYSNLLRYIQQPFEANLHNSFQRLAELDARRGLDSSTIFKQLYTLKETHYGNKTV